MKYLLTKALNISNMIQKCNGIKKTENKIISMLSDIACGVDIIRLALPNSGEMSNKYNLWLMMSSVLQLIIMMKILWNNK